MDTPRFELLHRVCHGLLCHMLGGVYFEIRLARMTPVLAVGTGLWAAYVLGSDLIGVPAMGETEEDALHWLASYLIVRIRRFGPSGYQDLANRFEDELKAIGLEIPADAVSIAEQENTFDALVRRWSIHKAFVDLSNRVRRLEGKEEEFIPVPPMEAALWEKIILGRPVR